MTTSKKGHNKNLSKTEIYPPFEFLARDGFLVESGERFRVHDPASNEGYHFDFSGMPVSDEIAGACYRMVCRYLKTKSLRYSFNAFHLFRDLVGSASDDSDSVESIDLALLNRWKHVREARGASFDIAMSFVVPFLRRWVESGEAGITEDVSIYLTDREGRVEGKEYVALRTNDPERGALTQREMTALTAELNARFETGNLTLAAYSLMWMFIGTGLRPVQIARMRVDDLKHDSESATDLYLSIPLAKGEGPYVGERWTLRAPTVLAEILREYVRHYDLVDGDAPLFPSARDPSLPASSPQLSSIVSRVGEMLSVFSPRLDGPMPLFPYRFRYTVGTRAVELGANDHVVARILTHRTTWSIKNYRAATAAGQRAVISALGDELETIAKAFRGKLVGNFSDASRSDEGMALIRDFERLSGREMGACGTRVECLQLAPIACLTCRHFEAFVDAPFEELLTQLVQEQDEEREVKIKQIYDGPVAALHELVRLQGAERLCDEGVET